MPVLSDRQLKENCLPVKIKWLNGKFHGSDFWEEEAPPNWHRKYAQKNSEWTESNLSVSIFDTLKKLRS